MDMPSHQTDAVDTSSASAVLTHLIRLLRRYRRVITWSLGIIAVAYFAFVVLLYATAPSQRVVTLPFRLDFSGASAGLYPNGQKFTTNAILNQPILLAVYNNNGLKRYCSFPQFARSLYITERNPEYERLETKYRARLADRNLSPVDRERIEAEFQARREGLSKNDYAVNYIIREGVTTIPDAVARKVVSDVLTEWARFIAVQQNVLEYDIPILSPAFVDEKTAPSNDVVAVLQLRSKLTEVLGNLDLVGGLPGVNLVRAKDGSTLREVRGRLQDLLRFSVEPLAAEIASSGSIAGSAAVTFVETQLEYDQRRLRAAEERVNGLREALEAYTQRQVAQRPATTDSAPGGDSSIPSPGRDTVISSFTDSFLDRLMRLGNMSADQQYRQRLVDELLMASKEVVPLREAAEYDRLLLANMRRAGGGRPVSQERVVSELGTATKTIREMITRLNEIYTAASESLNPASQIFSLTAPPSVLVERGVNLPRLLAYGILVLAAAFPAILIACLIHQRLRDSSRDEEDDAVHA